MLIYNIQNKTRQNGNNDKLIRIMEPTKSKKNKIKTKWSEN